MEEGIINQLLNGFLNGIQLVIEEANWYYIVVLIFGNMILNRIVGENAKSWLEARYRVAIFGVVLAGVFAWLDNDASREAIKGLLISMVLAMVLYLWVLDGWFKRLGNSSDNFKKFL